MFGGGYKIRDQSAPHFLTFATVSWVDVFTRKLYRDIVLDSLRFCQAEKGMLLHAWTIMSNHLHLVMSSKLNNLSGLLGDFKKFTAKEIIKQIVAHPRESRKEWMLEIFANAGKDNGRNENYQFWQQDNRPQEIYSSAFAFQKINYIHQNPVIAVWFPNQKTIYTVQPGIM